MFDIKKSNKAHIEGDEHFIVVRENTVYLRIVGKEGAYTVMTATAGEDDFVVNSHSNQDALIMSAQKVANLINTTANTKFDHNNRCYIEICSCEFISDAYRVAELLFKNLGD